MKCTVCDGPIPFYEEDVTVNVVYSDERGTMRHCHHNPFNEEDAAILAILGSSECLDRWNRQQIMEQSNVG